MARIGGLSAILVSVLFSAAIARAGVRPVHLAAQGSEAANSTQQALHHVFVGSFVAAGELLHSPVLSSVYADKLLLKSGDVVRFSVPKKHPPAVGDTYTSYVLGAELKHPQSNEYLGRTARVTGVLRILRVVDGQAEARIERTVSEVEPGQSVHPQPDPLWQEVSQHEADPQVAGFIVGLEHGALLGAQQRLAYIDRGSDDGIKLGDDLTVFLSPKCSDRVKRFDVAGRAVVVALQARTATCILVDTLWEIGPGATFAATHAKPRR